MPLVVAIQCEVLLLSSQNSGFRGLFFLFLSGEGADIKCESSPAAAADTHESGRVPPSYGLSLPTVS